MVEGTGSRRRVHAVHVIKLDRRPAAIFHSAIRSARTCATSQSHDRPGREAGDGEFPTDHDSERAAARYGERGKGRRVSGGRLADLQTGHRVANGEQAERGAQNRSVLHTARASINAFNSSNRAAPSAARSCSDWRSWSSSFCSSRWPPSSTPSSSRARSPARFTIFTRGR